MGSIRQNKIEAVIQTELAVFFQRHSAEICLGSMVTVTIVRVTSDLSHARCYLSFFTGPEKQTVLNNICLLYTSPSPRDRQKYRMPSSA